MADLTVNGADVAPVLVIEKHTAPAGEAFPAGAYVSLNDAGRLVKGGEGGGIALTEARHPGAAVSVLKKGIVDVGGALASLAFDAPVYEGTNGAIADTGTTAPLGRVVTGYGAQGGPQKLLRVDL